MRATLKVWLAVSVWAVGYAAILFTAYLCAQRGWLPQFLALDQFLIALQGVFVTIYLPESKYTKAATVFAFCVLGGLGTWATIREANDAEKTRIEAARMDRDRANHMDLALDQISSSTKQSVGIASTTAKLQQSLKDSASRIEELSVESIKTQTGGDSFCYMTFGRNTLGPQALRLLWPVGRYPLSDVRATIFDAASNDIFNPKERLQIGSMAEGLPIYLNFIDVGTGQDFNIEFVGKNGMWSESLKVRRVGEIWAQKIKVTRGKKVLYEWTDPEFPEGGR